MEGAQDEQYAACRIVLFYGKKVRSVALCIALAELERVWRCSLFLAGRRRKTPLKVGELLPHPCLSDVQLAAFAQAVLAGFSCDRCHSCREESAVYRGEDLRDTIDQLNKAFTYITAKSRTFAPAQKLKENLLGYMKAEEITYNAERDDFHPHIHAILEVRPSYFDSGYIKQKDWTALWRAALGVDYDPLVDVRNIKGGTAKAVAEVAKYPVKMNSILKIADRDRAAKALTQLYTAIFRRRLVTFGGDFKEYRRRLQLDDVETGDLTHVETEEKTFNAVAQVLFKWRADVGAYIC